jgi:hypothetical protein
LIQAYDESVELRSVEAQREDHRCVLQGPNLGLLAVVSA